VAPGCIWRIIKGVAEPEKGLVHMMGMTSGVFIPVSTNRLFQQEVIIK